MSNSNLPLYINDSLHLRDGDLCVLRLASDSSVQGTLHHPFEQVGLWTYLCYNGILKKTKLKIYSGSSNLLYVKYKNIKRYLDVFDIFQGASQNIIANKQMNILSLLFSKWYLINDI